MKPKSEVDKVLHQLTALKVEPITVYSTGPDDQLQIHVRLRDQTDLDRVAALNNGWRLTLMKDPTQD